MQHNNDLTLYFIRGIPGSGKSTFARTLSESLIIWHYEADVWFNLFNDGVFDPSKLHQAHTWCKNSAEHHLKNNFSVIVSNTSTTEKEVEPYASMAKTYNAKFVSLIVENRHGNKSVHNVPDATIQKMKDRFSIKL